MLVEFVATLAEFVRRRNLAGRRTHALIRNEAHYRMAVVPGRLVGEQFAGNVADCSEHHGPRQHFRVADFVQLFGRQVQDRVVIAALHLGDGPVVEIVGRLRIFPGARVVR